MSRLKPGGDLSLKWLEIFQICALKGSLQAAADECGLTVSTVSHHLRSLEKSLGIELFNHNKRPMVLTSKGRVFLRNIEGALHGIRRARAEASAGSISEASYLRIGAIEDLDSDIVPELAVYLSQTMPNCDFLYQSGTSQALLDLLDRRELDIAVAAGTQDPTEDLIARPMLRDPFVVIVHSTFEENVSDVLAGRTKLPFLRFSSNLIIARQIEAQLRRMGVALQNGFECANNQTLVAMVAAGAGWTITTPLLYSRAKRFHKQVKLCRFPGKSFHRTLALVSTPDCAESVVELVDMKVRSLLEKYAVHPLLKTEPWLADSFALID
ncbi:MAG: LysR family transcriptional regulator [Pseudomonadota bacterium]